MKLDPVYHQFTVLYFPETDTWQISEEFSDGVYDCETYQRVSNEEYDQHHEKTDANALNALARALGNINQKEE